MGFVSPELDFTVFCRRVAQRDFEEALDAAGMESSLVHRDYHQRTGRHSFRRDSKQERYCNNLQHLVSMLMNGVYPPQCGDDFFTAVTPLMRNLLQRWRLGNLRDVFSQENIEANDRRAAQQHPLLAAVLEAREAGRSAAKVVYDGWRISRGDQELYDYIATAVLHLTVRERSPLGKRLAELAARYPHIVRVDRDFGSAGLVIAIHDMVSRPEQGMNIAAEEAALKVLQERLGVHGYVTSYES